MMGKKRHIAAIAGAAASVLLLTGGATMAQAEGLDEVREFHIEAQSLDAALIEFSEQADLQLMVQTELVAGRQSSGVNGALTSSDALLALLNDSELSFTAVGDDTVAVSKPDEGGDSDSGNGRTAGATPRSVMMAQAVEEQSQTSRRTETDSDEDEDERKRPIEEIIVTGTNIRGIALESSPVQIFDREDIQISGAATAQDFIQTLPQNFGGGSTDEALAGFPNDLNSNSNGGNSGTIGAGINLRGLGSGGTLVLLNGHRVAPSSGIGDFVDISMIPASAIERVEVLTDGASSIYGSDAVAGVVNFILRDDYEGAEASFRYGTATEGDFDEYRANITVGTNWNTGNALIAYEYFSQDNLSASDRSFSQSAPLPNDLLPSHDRHSVIVSASQEIASNFETFGDLVFSNRDSFSESTSASNFSFFPRDIESNNLNATLGGTLKLANTWFVDFSGTYSEIHNEIETFGDVVDLVGVTTVDSTIWTTDTKASGDIFNLPGGAVKLAIGGHYRTEDFLNFTVTGDSIRSDANRDVYSIFGEAFIPIVGSDNAVPGIERLEINVSGRYDEFSDFGSTANPKIGVLWAPVEALKFRGSYSTSFNPPPLGIIGGIRSATAAPTSFWNNIFGFTAPDPSIADVVVLTISGPSDSFAAETSRTFAAGFDFTQDWGRHHLVIRSDWFDIEFENRLGRTPVPGNTPIAAPNVAFTNPDLLPAGTVIFSPTAGQVDSVLSDLGRLIILSGADPLDAEILNFANVTRNLAGTFVSGFDFEASYSFDSSIGDLILGLDGTVLLEFKQQAAVTTPLIDQLNTLYNPIDLRLRGHAGFSNNGISANVFVNYTDNYRTENISDAAPLDSWVTVDLSLSYDTKRRFGQNALLNNTKFRLSVVNLMDQDPPSTPDNFNFGIFGFDPANASPLGRFVSFELTKALF